MSVDPSEFGGERAVVSPRVYQVIPHRLIMILSRVRAAELFVDQILANKEGVRSSQIAPHKTVSHLATDSFECLEAGRKLDRAVFPAAVGIVRQDPICGSRQE